MKDIKKSGFQFSNPETKELIFKKNQDFNKKKYKGLPISYNIESSEIEDNSAELSLIVEIGMEGQETPFYLKMTISSEFSWEEEVENISKKLLKQNAVTLLMGYARPLIAHLTVDAGYKPLNLPFVDLREDIKDMEE